MDGKKIIRIIILGYLIVGVVALGIGGVTSAMGYDGNLLSALSSSSKDTEDENVEDEDTESESVEDEDTEDDLAVEESEDVGTDSNVDASTSEEDTDELTALLEDAHSSDSTEAESASDDTEEATEESTSSEDTSEETTTDSTSSVLREGPYYQYTITSDFNLNIYNDPDTPTGSGGVIGTIPSGTTGYAIGQGSRRTLILYNDKYGYVSNTYVSLTEVSSEEYPDELKNVTWDNVVISE